MSEVMLDLETLSTRTNAVILVIAAIKFNRNDPELPLERLQTFYRRIDIQSCVEVGMHTDPKTSQWWDEQDSIIRKEAFKKERVNIRSALQDFTKFYGNSTHIWSQGANFDIPILDEAYRRCDLEPPWKFWQARDTRTIYDLANMSSKDLPKGKLHHALHDCHRQIAGVLKANKKINPKNR